MLKAGGDDLIPDWARSHVAIIDSTDGYRAYVGGTNDAPAGSWIYREGDSWGWMSDDLFTENWEPV